MEEVLIKKEVLNNEKKNNKGIIAILVVLILLIIGALVYVFVINKPKEEPKDNEPSKEETIKELKEVFDFVSDYPNPMPVSLKDGKPSSYKANDLTKDVNTTIIFNYMYIVSKNDSNNKYCNEKNECLVKVSELNSMLGLNIGNNYKVDEYVKEIVKKDNKDYYKVIVPITEFSLQYETRECKSNKADNKLTITCDVYEIIGDDLPSKEKLIGTGEYLYNLDSKLTFEKFNFKEIETSTTKTNEVNNQVVKEEYKTNDGKYTLKITNTGKIYINDKKIKEQDKRKESKRYMQIVGSFVDGTGANTMDPYVSFVLDKEKKLIVLPNTAPGNEVISVFGKYAIFAHREGFNLATDSNIYDFFTHESEGPTVYYTTTWKKLGYQLNTSFMYANNVIELCEDITYAEGKGFECTNKVLFDTDGNKVYKLTSDNQSISLSNKIYKLRIVSSNGKSDIYVDDKKVDTVDYDNVLVYAFDKYLVLTWPGAQGGYIMLGYINGNGIYYSKTDVYNVYSKNGKMYGYTILSDSDGFKKVELNLQ